MMTTKINNRMILGISLAVIAALTAGASGLNQIANADKDDPPFLPNECQQYVGQPSTAHVLTILTPAPYLPGDEVQLSAGTTDTGTGANRVRIVAILDGTTVIHQNLLILPNPYGSVNDSFEIPNDADPKSSVDIYACFESPGSLRGNGVTHHLGLTSFFVLPESPIGILALIGSSVAVLGGFMALKSRSSRQSPL
jgi:hypothetical protein